VGTFALSWFPAVDLSFWQSTRRRLDPVVLLTIESTRDIQRPASCGKVLEQSAGVAGGGRRRPV